MIGRRRPYLSYLLRLWLVEDDGLVWRASLENPRTAERHGFAALDDLVGFLLAQTRDIAAQEEWQQTAEAKCRARTEVMDMAFEKALKDLLGRAVADEEFRSLLLADPERALREGGFDLTAEELAALLETDRGGVAEGLDQRLSKMVRWDT